MRKKPDSLAKVPAGASIEDPSLRVRDVMAILGVSRSFAYEVMAQVGVERFAKKCIRVRRSALEAWRKEHQEECVSASTSVATSTGLADLKTSGGGRSLARPIITVRTKPRTPPAGS